MATGTVTWYTDEKGYGFIAPDQGGAKLVVHVEEIRVVPKTLTEGQRVSYELKTSARGSNNEAGNVQLI